MWILIFLLEEDGEKLADIIPSVWKIDENNCWYPKNLSTSVIKSLARKQIAPDHSSDNWECCSMQIVENNISEFEIGFKMMIKLSKNAKNLNSDNEQRGRGRRHKYTSSKRQFSDLEDNDSVDEDVLPLEDCKKLTKKTDSSYPLFPSNKKTMSKEDIEIYQNESTYSTPSSSKQNLPCLKISGSSKDMSSIEPSNESPCFTNQEFPSTNVQCKISKRMHSCTFEHKGKNNDESMLFSIAHQLCKLSAENKKIMTNVCYIKQELNSFVENKLHCTDDDSINVSNENILAPFPLKTENELMIIESKLQSEDLAYTNKLVSSFVFASEGKSITKVTTNMLKAVFSYELASKYSWKGQKNKKKLYDLKICKVIIDVVCKKFPNQLITETKTSIIGSIQTWFARAPFQIELQSKNKKKLETAVQTSADDINTDDQPL